MATGGSQEDPDTCPVCLETLRQPKFLPCHHTFCSHCIQDVADRHPGRTFPCPSCRAPTSLPPGGVASLQTNFYLPCQPAQQGPAVQDLCPVHPEEQLRFYCLTCEQAICRDCRLTRHHQHEADDLAPVAGSKREDLQTDRQRLQRAVSDITEHVTSLEEERQAVDRKRAAMERNIRDRYQTVVAAVQSKMEEELLSLQAVFADLDQDAVRAIEQQEGNKVQVSSLLQQVNSAITSATDSDVITVAKEMRSGRGSQAAIDTLTSRGERPVRRPVLHVNVCADVMIQTTRDYIGSVGVLEVEQTGPEMRVTERFQCAQDPDVEVFSLCHEDTDPPVVLVSYAKKDLPCNRFTETGECVYTSSGGSVGRMSGKRVAEGQSMYLSSQLGRFRTSCKSPTAANLLLDNRLSGQATIKRVRVTSRDPFKIKTKAEFTIKVGPHRAFDVDDAELYFAVVEEAKEPNTWRSVRLYQRSVKTAVSVYCPPATPYQPSDVCFYRLGGQSVLLVTDEHNDVIHVVSFQGGKMCFQRYLCGGCPSIVQPTAIAVDILGRLWLACRGGAIVTLEPIVGMPALLGLHVDRCI